MSRRHTPRAGFWIRLCVTIIYPFDSLAFRIRWHHLDRVPPPGQGVIIALNHVNQIDTVLMARMIWQSGRIPRFMVKNTLFDVPVLGLILRGARQIPVFRGTDVAADSVVLAKNAVDRGEAVVIYPEGTTTKDPRQWPMRGKTGVARLVLLTPHAPVVPIGQWGAQRPARWLEWLQRRRVVASVGPPLDLSGYAGATAGADELHAITDEIMAAVREQVALVRGEPAPSTFYAPGDAGA